MIPRSDKLFIPKNSRDSQVRLFFRLFIKTFFVPIVLFVAAETWAAPPDLHVVGNQILTVSNGCTIRLKGVDIASLEWTNGGDGPPGQGITESVAQSLSTWKANIIRLPMNQDKWFGCEGATAASYQAIVDSIVAYCNANNAYVLLDLHWSGTNTGATAPCGGGWGSDNTTQQQNMPDDNSVTFWSDVAAHYANNPAVLFDLYNEPRNDSWTIWRNGGTSGSGFHTPGLQSLLTTIRGRGANNVIVAGELD
jgi:endoglucanase